MDDKVSRLRIMMRVVLIASSYRNDKEKSGYIQCLPPSIPLTLSHSHTSAPDLYPNLLIGSTRQQI